LTLVHFTVKCKSIEEHPRKENVMSTLSVDFETAEQMTGVSRFTLRKYVKTGRLRVVRVGRRVVIPVSELEKMFSPGAVSTLGSNGR
jgi:excisionase family DNA binding protein